MRDTDATPVRSNAKQIRIARGRNKMVAAVKAGITLDTLTKIERGQINVHYSAILRLAYSMGCSPTDLYPGMTACPNKEIRSDERVQKVQAKRVKLRNSPDRLPDSA